MKANSIEEYFGTLQQSTVETWKSHLKASENSEHEILNDFYEDIVDLVDALIESYMGLHGKVENYKNLMSGDDMNPKEYLESLRELAEDGKKFFDEDELKSGVDDILNLIDGTLYKLKELVHESHQSKSLRDFLNESLVVNNPQMISWDDNKKIDHWLRKMGITDFFINGDMTITTKGSVDLSGRGLTEIPSYIQFKRIGGEEFDVSNNDLSTLRGCPIQCHTFRCKNNPRLRTLRGGPMDVKIYNCAENNLTALTGAPKTCIKFICSKNHSLTSLKYAPRELVSDEYDNALFNCEECGIDSMEGFMDARSINIDGKFKSQGNPYKLTTYKAKQCNINAKSYVCEVGVRSEE